MRIKAAVFISLLFVLFFPFNASAEYDYNSKEFIAVVSQLDMQGHANDDLASCPVKQLYYEEVLTMLNDGMSGEEVIAYYVEQYGQAALKEPGLDLGGIVAWTMPVVGLAAGTVVVFLWLKKRTETKKTTVAEEVHWQSQSEKEITAKVFDEERRKNF